jgi:DNA-binding beta-propeller fold protein YncE
MCAVAVLTICASACNLDNPGFSPPRGRITYPIGLALSTETTAQGEPRYLYVANSNFDLRYNAGSVHAYDLQELGRALDENDCWALPEEPTDLDAGADAQLDAGAPAEDPDGQADASDEPVEAGDEPLDDAGDEPLDDAGDEPLDDAGDEPLDAGDEPLDADGLPEAGSGDSRVPQFVPDAQSVGPGLEGVRRTLCDGRTTNPEDESACCFGAQSALDKLRSSEVLIDSYASGLALSADGKHLYVPVRGQTRLVYLDVDGERGGLGCGDAKKRCERGPGLGTKAEVEDREFAPQPTAIVTGTFEQLGAQQRQSEGFVATAHERGAVSLFHIASSGRPELIDVMQTGGQRVVSLSKDENSQLLFVSSTAANVVLRVGAQRPSELRMSATPMPDEPLRLYATSSIVFSGPSQSGDIRDVLSDSRPRQAGQPERVFALVRGTGLPVANYIQSVAFLELSGNNADGRFARVVDLVRVGTGPSKLEQVELGGRHLLFASCYDEGSIYVIDTDTHEIVTVIREVSGPFEMQPDARRQLLYVADFRASVVRVVDLHGLVDRAAPPPRIVATLGAPTFRGGIQ